VNRRAYIDWVRGLAVVVMMEWHVIDSWSVNEGRDSTAFEWITFIGGWAAPMFLYLAGVSVALAAASRMARGLDLRAASWAVQKRGWQIFGVAHLFRLQSYLMSRGASWTSLFKPDILNILGLGMVAAAFCWGRARSRFGRALWLAGSGLAVVLLSPGSRLWWWPTLLPVRFEAYIRPVAHAGVFQIFPSMAYVLFGAFVGALVAAPREASRERPFHAWLAAGGAALLGVGAVGTTLPAAAATSDFWTTSLSLVLMRTGAITLMLPLAWLWMRRPTAAHWSPMVLLGRTSLFVYWVHVELAYGVLSGPIHHTMALPAAVVAYAALVAVMTAAAAWWIQWTPPRLPARVPVRPQSSVRPRP
jgi:uncharacterized membrane protein